MGTQGNRILDRLLPNLAGLFRAGRSFCVPPLPHAGVALIAEAARSRSRDPVLIITDGPRTLETAHRDFVSILGSNKNILYYPPWESLPGTGVSPDHDITGNRLDVLARVNSASNDGLMVVTCIQALMQKTIDSSTLEQLSVRLSPEAETDLDDFAETLVASGYEFGSEVAEKGRAARRGGIVDVWPPSGLWPLRIEFLGSAVESIRTYDPATQRSRSKLESVVITPSDEWGLLGSRSQSLVSHLPLNSVFIYVDPDAMSEHAALCEETAGEAGAKEFILRYEALRADINADEHIRIFVGPSQSDAAPEVLPDIRPAEGIPDLARELVQPDLVETARHRLISEALERAKADEVAVFFMDTEGSFDHFLAGMKKKYGFKDNKETRGNAEIKTARLTRRDKDKEYAIEVVQAPLSQGFVSDMSGLIVVCESDLYGKRNTGTRRYDPHRLFGAPGHMVEKDLADLGNIEPGELVVHVDHGLGRYRGLNEIVFNNRRQEVLTIEYAEGSRLHVPVSQAHLLTRYVGSGKHDVRLHTLGGRKWARDKESAERSIMDMASSLLEIQAKREVLKGHASSADTIWQSEFEASFPYVETNDQLRVISEVKNDMESPRPMDRLVCGDAGYGKTEIAMRAAFKTVMDGAQVAMLVPTTVLAQQHFRSFSERMAPYPVRLEMLSRLAPPTHRGEIINGLTEGTVDIVIGTHSLLQPGVRFKNLGLVIVDEEQRFGVIHKEKLKHMRSLVDVLTMTATPIPRTLYLSLTGARDMSLIRTPPSERMAIETIVTPDSDEVVRSAIVRELNREGQVFYLHNRVMSIEVIGKRLQRIVPEARIEIAHGQMPPARLSSVMRRFSDGEFDLLLCTTIVESGTDVPRANTILIDRADRFGMADLYQLRGRVGRSSRKGYAYLLLPSHGRVDPEARKRIGAIKKYSSLSAGFNLALKDLEIRGSGNILGAAQSGHIAAIGFGLYCQLLKRAVAQMKNEDIPPLVSTEVNLDFISLSTTAAEKDSSAMIPHGYMEDEHDRVAAYRKMAGVSSPEEVEELRLEFRDRFGPLPEELSLLLKVVEMRTIAAREGFTRVETKDGKLVAQAGEKYLKKENRFPRLKKETAEGKLDEIIEMLRTGTQSP